MMNMLKRWIMMTTDRVKKKVKECLFVGIDVISMLNELSQIEKESPSISYDDVLTDLKWTRNILRNRLYDLQKED